MLESTGTCQTRLRKCVVAQRLNYLLPVQNASDLRHMLGKFLASAVRGCMFLRGICVLINFKFVREFLVDEDRALCPTTVPTLSSQLQLPSRLVETS